MDWVMSPSSGDALLCFVKSVNAKIIGRFSPFLMSAIGH
ncbi:hypothetical protein ECP03019043_0294 [Escherichia coli P0301904.3]|nr:hypothetical protein ECP03019043_0294 [Escherichia coli P0301904.3]